MSDIAIKVSNLSKRYYTGSDYEFDLRATLGKYIKSWLSLSKAKKKDSEAFWALKDISFEVKKGEVFGIIGANGAGKSTLLKILSRIILPTEGTAEIYGRVSSLLEVGTGFHPDLTGRENVFFNGVILGMKQADITKKFDEIVAFSGIEKFIDTPVKRYSSGMKVRLAFSIAVHLESEVMIIDEVLSVGDVAFRQKSLDAIRGMLKKGRTVLVVSHSTDTINKLCDKVIVLEHGKLIYHGLAADATKKYLASQTKKQEIKNNLRWTLDNAPGNDKIKVLAMQIKAKGRSLEEGIFMGDDIEISLEYYLPKNIQSLNIGWSISDNMQNEIVTIISDKIYKSLSVGHYKMIGTIPNNPYNERFYHLNFQTVINQDKPQRWNKILTFFIYKKATLLPSYHNKYIGFLRPLQVLQSYKKNASLNYDKI